MKLSVLFGILVLSGLTLVATGQDTGCPSEEDAASFEADSFFKTSQFLENERDLIPEVEKVGDMMDMVQQKQNDGDLAPSDDLNNYIKAVGDNEALAEDQYILPYYYPVCPYRWYKLPRYVYYYRVINKEGDIIKIYYYWTYYPIWVTSCATIYCHLSGTWWSWDYRYRCYPLYRYIWTWVLVLEVTVDRETNTVTYRWYRRVIRLRVPRGCQCRRYWPWLAAAARQCPVRA